MNDFLLCMEKCIFVERKINNINLKHKDKMTIEQFNFAGKKAIVRVDFNVPLDEKGNVTDDTRIRGALPTLKKVLADGGALIMMSHMGKPKGKVKPELSLSQIVKNVSDALGVDVKFAKDCANADAEVAALKPGEALLLENLRFYPEEEGKPVGVEKGTPEYDEAKKEMKVRQKEFAKKLASYADCYVMDAFGTAHRKHASTAVIADFFDKDHKMLGYLMEKEVKAVDAVLNNIKRPFTAIMGGSKVSTKIGIIENLLGKVDNLILCGGMTYTFAKAQGGKIGKSICEDDKLDVALDVIKKAKENNVKLVLGTDSIIADDFKNDANQKVCPSNDIPDGWEGMDAGPETRKAFADAIKGSKTILWNGPAGVFEFDNFTGGSKAIAEAVAAATKEGAFSLIGGGDSVACVNKFGLADQVSYISTGGGALLEAIEGKVLPGVAAIAGE
jgi:phosphoglycerate kinase